MREGRLDEQVPASYAVGALHASSPISHVIPLRLPQTLKWHRWNCNVLSGARKMTVGNYVRLLSGKVRRCRCCPAGALHASSPISHVIPLRLPQTLKWHRWNCNVLGGARKMTVGNYVRLLSGRARRFRCGHVLVLPWPVARGGAPGIHRNPDTASFRCLHTAHSGPLCAEST